MSMTNTDLIVQLRRKVKKLRRLRKAQAAELAIQQAQYDALAGRLATADAERDELLTLAEAAWGVIANVGPIEEDPPSGTPGWSEAAVAWRERYHAVLDRIYPHHRHVHVSMEPAHDDDPVTTDDLVARYQAEQRGIVSHHNAANAGLTDLQVGERARLHREQFCARHGVTVEQLSQAIADRYTATGSAAYDDLETTAADPDELARLAALADEVSPLRTYEPMAGPAGIVTQDNDTGEVSSTADHSEARIVGGDRVEPAAPAPTPGYVPQSPEAQAAMAEPAYEVDAEPREGETWDGMMERHAAHAESSSAESTPSMGTVAMDEAIKMEGTYTVTAEDGSTATYLHDAVVGRDDPIYTTPPTLPPIEVEPERYEALLTYLREEMDAEEPMADATDILRALGLWVRPGPDPEPTDLERLAAIAPPTGAIDRLVADVLAHVQGGPNSPGGWFLDAADALYPGLGTFRSSQRDHIWNLATELARQRIQADHTATAIILEREQEALAVTTERVGRFTETLAGYDAMLAQLGAPPA